MALADFPVRDLLARFSASDPTPGGGSASALASAIGASLLMMVAALPKTRGGSAEDRAALAGAAEKLSAVRGRLTAARGEDPPAPHPGGRGSKQPEDTPGAQGGGKGG